MTTPVVELTRVTVGYGAQPVLGDVSLTVRAGEVVAVLGANGSGKSTLIRTALGLLPPDAGTARLFGQPATRFAHRDRVGYVPQRLGAGAGVPATVTEVVAAGRLPRRRFLRPARAVGREAVAEAIRTVGLADRARDPVGILSGGQQQRVLIARALATRPDLLVMDEPTAGVDTASQLALAGALRSFVVGGGTVLLVAHELGPLRPLVNRSVVLHLGAVVHDGPVPPPAGHHADPAHEHVHPHAPRLAGHLFTGGGSG